MSALCIGMEGMKASGGRAAGRLSSRRPRTGCPYLSRQVSSPTVRSLAKLRKDGYVAEIVEKFNSFTKTRKDLWGIIDILAIRRDEVLGVQTTSWANVSARVKKITDSEHIGAIREAGIRVVVHGWKKNPKTNRWEVREVDLS